MNNMIVHSLLSMEHNMERDDVEGPIRSSEEALVVGSHCLTLSSERLEKPLHQEGAICPTKVQNQ